jgi:hypothetical protein
MPAEILEFQVNPQSALKALADINSAISGNESRFTGSNKNIEASFQKVQDTIFKLTDRSQQATERYITSLERQAAAINKTPVDKLIQQRDQLIAKLGTEEKSIQRVTAAYEKLIAAASGEKGGNFKQFGEGIANFIESPVKSAGTAISGLLEGAGAIGGVIAGGAAAFGAFAVAGYEAAKSLGEYGTRLRDVELRTGLSTKEVQEFSYAAKAVGQDVSVVERTMRGLTTAIEDTSTKGAVARDVLRSFGVDIEGVRAGTVSTKDVLIQISEGLNKLPTTWERNKAAMDLFKRAGVEIIPFMTELNEHLKETGELQKNFATKEDEDRYRKYQTQIAGISTEWDNLARKLKEPLAGTVLFSLKWMNGSNSPQDQIRAANASNVSANAAGPSPAETFLKDFKVPGINTGVDSILSAGQNNIAAGNALLSGHQGANDGTIEGAQKKLETLKKAYDDARTSEDDLTKSHHASTQAAQAAINSTNDAASAYERQKATVDSLTKAQSELKSNLAEIAKLQQEAAFKSDHPYGLTPVNKQVAAFAERPGMNQDLMNQGMAIFGPQLTKEAQDTIKKAHDLQVEWARKTVETLTKKSGENSKADTDFTSDQARQYKILEQKVSIGEKTYNAQTASDQSQDEGAARIAGILDPSKDARFNTQAQLLTIKKQYADEAYQHDLELAEALHSQDGLLEDAKTELRIKHAEQVSQLEMQLQEQVAEEYRKQFDTIKSASEQLWNTLFTKPQEFGKQLTNTVKTAALKPVTDSLSNMTATALHPLIYGADGHSGLAGALKFGGATQNPVIGVTNINTEMTRANSEAIDQLNNTLSHGIRVAGCGSGGSGSGSGGSYKVPFFGTFGGSSKGNGFSLGSASLGGGGRTPDVTSSISYNGPASGGFSLGSATLGSDSDYSSDDSGSSYSGPSYSSDDSGSSYSGPSYSSTGASGGFVMPSLGLGGFGGSSIATPSFTGSPIPGFGGSSGSGSGSGGLGGFGGILKNFKGTNWGGFTRTGQGMDTNSDGENVGDTDDDSGDTIAGTGSGSGSITGVNGLAGGVLMAGGMSLAEKGLLGNSRGTWTGVGESTAGGAMIGLKYGGPIGAVIGAAAGFGASVGEMLAGVESPMNKAKRLVKQKYNITISNQMATQIASIAQSKYGNNVSIAVASPEVRQLLGLYAAGTGQKMAVSSAIPQAASFSEQGGKLSQDASYQYGKAYSFESSLPISGGINTQTLPNPSSLSSNAPVSLSLNIGNQGAADFLAGNVVTPDFVQSQWSSAQSSSNGRLGNSATIQQPGLIVS